MLEHVGANLNIYLDSLVKVLECYLEDKQYEVVKEACNVSVTLIESIPGDKQLAVKHFVSKLLQVANTH